MRSLWRMGLGIIGAIMLMFSLAGTASANCHHHPHNPPPKHVTVSASFTDQTCVDGNYTPGGFDAPLVDGTTRTFSGDDLPGTTLTVTYTANQGYVIDSQSIFTHTYPDNPTDVSCKPTFTRASYKYRSGTGCSPARRYVQVYARHHIASVTIHHNAKRTRFHLRVRAAAGSRFKDGSRVDLLTVAIYPPTRCGHPHGS